MGVAPLSSGSERRITSGSTLPFPVLPLPSGGAASALAPGIASVPPLPALNLGPTSTTALFGALPSAALSGPSATGPALSSAQLPGLAGTVGSGALSQVLGAATPPATGTQPPGSMGPLSGATAMQPMPAATCPPGGSAAAAGTAALSSVLSAPAQPAGHINLLGTAQLSPAAAAAPSPPSSLLLQALTQHTLGGPQSMSAVLPSLAASLGASGTGSARAMGYTSGLPPCMPMGLSPTQTLAQQFGLAGFSPQSAAGAFTLGGTSPGSGPLHAAVMSSSAPATAAAAAHTAAALSQAQLLQLQASAALAGLNFAPGSGMAGAGAALAGRTAVPPATAVQPAAAGLRGLSSGSTAGTASLGATAAPAAPASTASSLPAKVRNAWFSCVF